MPSSLLARMDQTTLDLVVLLDAHRDASAEETMTTLMRLADALDDGLSLAAAIFEARDGHAGLEEAIVAVIPPARSCGARDLLEISKRCMDAIRDLPGPDSPLDARASGLLVAWTAIARQTSIASKLLFHAARLYGRAPNGKTLPD